MLNFSSNVIDICIGHCNNKNLLAHCTPCRFMISRSYLSKLSQHNANNYIELNSKMPNKRKSMELTKNVCGLPLLCLSASVKRSVSVDTSGVKLHCGTIKSPLQCYCLAIADIFKWHVHSS